MEDLKRDNRLVLFEGGKYKDTMPLLGKVGYVPATTVEIMRYRLESENRETKEVKIASTDVVWKYGDIFAIQTNAQALRNVTRATDDLSLNSSIDIQKTWDAPRFSYGELEKAGVDRPLSFEEVISHPVWLILAGNDKQLLRDYAEVVFSAFEGRYMGFYLNRIRHLKKPTPTGYPLAIYPMYNGGSDAQTIRVTSPANILGIQQIDGEGELKSQLTQLLKPVKRDGDTIFVPIDGQKQKVMELFGIEA